MRKAKSYLQQKGTPSPELRGHIWIEGRNGTFLGYGRIALLERIREYGSITKAAKALEMSYRRAWVLIDSMNHQVPRPFVVSSAGGKKGGGTLVTAEGEKAIAEFWKIHNDFQKFLRGKDRAVAAILGDENKGSASLREGKRR